MAIRQSAWQIKGMMKDLDASKFNGEYAYNIVNMRWSPSESDSTALCWSLERQPKKMDLTLLGSPIGAAEVSTDELVVFTTGINSTDKTLDIEIQDSITVNNEIPKPYPISISAYKSYDNIYKIQKTEEGGKTVFKSKLLYHGNLNFNKQNPLETLTFFENNKIKKVYWIDGINQFRYINIEDPKLGGSSTGKFITDTYFDISKPVQKTQMSVTKNLSSGSFVAGCIQYFITYYNNYGTESAIVCASPLKFIYFDNNRGGKVDELCTCNFEIAISELDYNYDYIRVYSLHRSALDGSPTCKIIQDCKIENNESINIKDLGIVGETVDPQSLFFLGADEIIANAMTQKNNTLFLGNIEYKNNSILDVLGTYDYNSERTVSKTVGKTKYYDKVEDYETLVYPKEDLDSYDSPYFQYGEYYRLGYQFQYKNGKWSEVVYHADAQAMESDTAYKSNVYAHRPKIEFQVSLNNTLIKKAREAGYIKVRPMVVYPEMNDRRIVAQGILCPTVFNLKERINNSMYAQSSWVFRPMSATPITYKNTDTEFDWNYYREEVVGTINTSSDTYKGKPTTITASADIQTPISTVEYRHFYPLKYSNLRGCEIQNMNYPNKTLESKPYCGLYIEDPNIFYYGEVFTPTTDYQNGDYKYSIFKNEKIYSDNEIFYFPYDSNKDKVLHHYYVDSNILTFHSPEITFGDIPDAILEQCDLHIIGVVPLISTAWDISLTTEGGVFTESEAPISKGLIASNFSKGYSCKDLRDLGIQSGGGAMLVSGALYNALDWYKTDDATNSNDYTFIDKRLYNYILYPWQEEGSIVAYYRDKGKWRKDYAQLKSKVISNIRIAFNNLYRHENNDELQTTKIPICDIKKFKQEDGNPVLLDIGGSSIWYYGNVDSVTSLSDADNKTLFRTSYNDVIKSNPESTIDNINRPYKAAFYGKNTSKDRTFIEKDMAPLSIKYKSTSHIVLSLGKNSNNYNIIKDIIADDNVLIPLYKTDHKLAWDRNNDWNINPITPGLIGTYSINSLVKSWLGANSDVKTSFLYIAELIRSNHTPTFGGKTPFSMYNLNWMVAGETVDIPQQNITTVINLTYTRGDTYYQRYDCLKTYPYNLESKNSLVDIVSFKCESKHNMAGRCDANKGNLSNLGASPTNFNLFNTAYDQQDNFFTYKVPYDTITNLKYPNTILWSGTKYSGDKIDKWTTLNSNSTLDLEGDKGAITSLEKVNDSIIAFQEHGISQVMYNEQTQLTTTAGLPIEIANSGKVSGYKYISNTIGTSNKWSIRETPKGLFFIDNSYRSIYNLGESLVNITNNAGFKTWAYDNLDCKLPWNPTEINNYRTYFDSRENELLFHNNNEVLAYNIENSVFTSFYTYYTKYPYFLKLGSNNYWLYPVSDSKCDYTYLAEHHTGGYAKLPDMSEDHPIGAHLTIYANEEPTFSKTFNNLEFRTSSHLKDTQYLSDDDYTRQFRTFDTLIIENDYQKTIEQLRQSVSYDDMSDKKEERNNYYYYTNKEVTKDNHTAVIQRTDIDNLRKKFSSWRVTLPRNNKYTTNNTYNRDRFKNYWTRFTLSYTPSPNEDNYTFTLRDLVVHYFI